MHCMGYFVSNHQGFDSANECCVQNIMQEVNTLPHWDTMLDLGRVCVQSSDMQTELVGMNNTYCQRQEADARSISQVVSLFCKAVCDDVKDSMTGTSSGQISLISVNSGDMGVCMSARDIGWSSTCGSVPAEADVESMVSNYIRIISLRLNEATGHDVSSFAGLLRNCHA